jgi:hypothetical protein
MNPKENFYSCSQCVHRWCDDCHSQMQRCPYCRKQFHLILSNGRLRQVEERIMRNISMIQLHDIFPVLSDMQDWYRAIHTLQTQIYLQVRPIVRQVLREYRSRQFTQNV